MSTLLNLGETTQLNLPLKPRTRRVLTKEEKRTLRQMHTEGKSREEIGLALGLKKAQVGAAERYHIKRKRPQNPLRRATKEALEEELLRRATTRDAGKGLTWALLGVVGLVVLIAAIRTIVHV